MNKEDLIAKIKSLDGITQDERAFLINLVNTKKKYGLVWEDKPEDVEEQLRENLPVLREVIEKRILSKELPARKKDDNTLFDGQETGEVPYPPNHILIEGDNLHALTALTFTHEGKIDVMYFDPPYNTGNRDFKYNDVFVDKEDEYRHSKWLSFMHKRLSIARKLLSDNGIIFISIDDKEQSQLKMLCDSIFGESCFVESIIWKNKYGPGAMTKGFGNIHEYIISYTKKQLISIESTLSDEEIKNYKNKDEYYPVRGGFITQPLATKSKDDRPNLVYPVIHNGREIWPDKQWIWSKDRVLDAQAKNYLCINGDSVRFKQYLKDENGNMRKAKPISIFIGPYNQDGTKELELLFENKIFNNPKPTALISRLLSMTINGIDNKSITILDIFAGSGTTLHSTMQLNSEDGGKRQCILVTNNENKICEEVTYVRNKRVIQGYTNSKGELVSGLTNNNLRYYKSEFVPRDPSLKNKRILTKLATELLSIKENCYTDCTKELIDEKQSWFRLFSDGASKFFLVIYDDDKIEQAVKIIKQLVGDKHPQNPIKVYVFSNGQYPYTEEFEDVLPDITLCALPDAIYKAYQNVLPAKKRVQVPELEEQPDNGQSEIVLVDSDLFNQEG